MTRAKNQPRHHNNRKQATKSTQRAQAKRSISLQKAMAAVAKQPHSAAAWKELCAYWLSHSNFADACEPAEKAYELAPNDPETMIMLAAVTYQHGNDKRGIELLRAALKILPKSIRARHDLSVMLYHRGQYTEALAEIEQAQSIDQKNYQLSYIQGACLKALHRHDEALAVLENLKKIDPENHLAWIDAGTIYNEMGDTDKALEHYQHAMSLNRQDTTAYSNFLTTLHYHPESTAEYIFSVCKQWEQDNCKNFTRMTLDISDKNPKKKLRVGMISDGFRMNPVGHMITPALEHLPKHSIELIAYTTNNAVDGVTQRIQAQCTEWIPIPQTHGKELAERIRNDKIDILIDLAGHNNGTRMPAVAMKPAPIIIKWVGGLINTTGLSTIDYLISDRNETPEGVDSFYTEKLIRLPNDYICYQPPAYAPPVKELPALNNGYITLGCFNNSAKINKKLLTEWAKIMHKLPNSKLFLKSFQYNSKSLIEKFSSILANEGIDHSRLIFEGSSPHKELLDSYNKVDIALDPWPYSGGLTTCEAFVMGVPVVTLPGPTFAGRHSATHLINAGMPELVTNSWEEYRARVIELASDIDSLSIIRSHLPTILRQSPVCDAISFSKHLNNALRAVWQRYIEGHTPAALNFTNAGQAFFQDEKSHVELNHPEQSKPVKTTDFIWEFKGRIIAIDHSAKLIDKPVIKKMLEMGTLELITFDPASNQLKHPLLAHNNSHYYPNISLGDGQPGILYACQEATRSGTLKPDPKQYLQEEIRRELETLVELPIKTLALDAISELAALDWLVLDDLNDSLAILNNGAVSLSNTLLLHAEVAFQPTHIRQPTFSEVNQWAERNNFRFYCFHEPRHQIHAQGRLNGASQYANELVSGTALFIPDYDRMQSLNNSDRLKLAFIADFVYSLEGLSYDVLSYSSKELAQKYIDYKTDQLKTHNQPTPSRHEINSTEQSTSIQSNSFAELRQKVPDDISLRTAEKSDQYPKMAKAIFDWNLEEPIKVVDIGANPIDGSPPYRELLEKGYIDLVGFEPQREALSKLNRAKGEHELYLPYAVGDGSHKTLYICAAEGMTSTLEPNFDVLNLFQGYPVWAKIEKKIPIKTVRLDDLDSIQNIDWLKIDIQGGELSVFKNAEEKLKNCLVIQTEVNFIKLYKNQPLFADIDLWMREHGFMLHALLEQRRRLFSPMIINNQIHEGINQLTTADAVYVVDFNKLNKLNNIQKIKLSIILHSAYKSYDAALNIMGKIGRKIAEDYLKNIDAVIMKKEPSFYDTKNIEDNTISSELDKFLGKN